LWGATRARNEPLRMTPTQVTEDRSAGHVVVAPARLHLGFVDLSGALDRQFGSIGLCIDGLDTCVRAAAADSFGVDGVTPSRLLPVLERVSARCAPGRAVQVTVEQMPPAHAGLGSGTQLALAAALAAAHALGANLPPRELAALAGRGQRSGIGIAAFEGGGFVVDGGRGPATVSPPLLARLAFPADWRCVLVFDAMDEGLSGQRERAAFTQLAPMSDATAAGLARTILVGLMPALVEADFAAFARHLATVQAANGDHFAPAQGGRYTSRRVGELLTMAAREFGLPGIGQSSWGPTGFLFAPDAASAAAVADFIDARKADGLRCQIVTGNNVGARCGWHGERGDDLSPTQPVWLIRSNDKDTDDERPLSAARL